MQQHALCQFGSSAAVFSRSTLPRSRALGYATTSASRCRRSGTRVDMPALSTSLAPAMEVRQVARVPGLAESGSAEVPVRANFLRHGAQIAAEVLDRRAAP